MTNPPHHQLQCQQQQQHLTHHIFATADSHQLVDYPVDVQSATSTSSCTATSGYHGYGASIPSYSVNASNDYSSVLTPLECDSIVSPYATMSVCGTSDGSVEANSPNLRLTELEPFPALPYAGAGVGTGNPLDQSLLSHVQMPPPRHYNYTGLFPTGHTMVTNSGSSGNLYSHGQLQRQLPSTSNGIYEHHQSYNMPNVNSFGVGTPHHTASVFGYHQHQSIPLLLPPADQHFKMKGRPGTRRSSRSDSITNEEDERKKQRRERNKEAAARCRKRRVDQTQTLEKQVEQLKNRLNGMHDQVALLEQDKEQLINQLGHSGCRANGVKTTNLVMNRTEPGPQVVKPEPTEMHATTIMGVVNSVSGTSKLIPPSTIHLLMQPKPVVSNSSVITSIPSVISHLNGHVHPRPQTKKLMSPATTLSKVVMPAPNSTIVHQRPTTLYNVTLKESSSKAGEEPSTSNAVGVDIETPSNFKADPMINNLLEGSTGLTPTLSFGITPISMANLPTTTLNTPNLETPVVNITGDKMLLNL